jgi:hypothetical protein
MDREGGEFVDPNKMYISEDPYPPIEHSEFVRRRTFEIQDAVRAALAVLNAPERFVIEGYYFDGRSFPRLATMRSVTLSRIKSIHRRALTKLEIELTPFVEQMFGIAALKTPDCPICRAEWRTVAEQLLDEKTPDMTWGDVAARIERAVGWHVPTPRVLTTHQNHHRRFVMSSDNQPKEEDDDQAV